MWTYEDLDISKEYLIQTLENALSNQGLPTPSESITVKLLPRCGNVQVTYLYQGKPYLYSTFTVDFSTMASFDADIEVRPKRKGYGTKLHHAREAYLGALGINTIDLTQVMDGSQGFWTRMGFS